MAVEDFPQELTTEELAELRYRRSESSYHSQPLFSNYVLLDRQGWINRRFIELSMDEYELCLEQFASSIKELPEVHMILQRFVNSEGVILDIAKDFGYKVEGPITEFINELKASWVRHMIQVKGVNVLTESEIIREKDDPLKLKSVEFLARKIVERTGKVNAEIELREMVNTIGELMGPVGFSLAEAMKRPETWDGYPFNYLSNEVLPSLNITQLEFLIYTCNIYIAKALGGHRFQEILPDQNSGLSIVSAIRTIAVDKLSQLENNY